MVNLLNKLTIIRVCLIPLFIAALLFDHGDSYTMRIVANVLFVVVSLVDLFDGRITREYDLTASSDEFMGPPADKPLACFTLVCPIELGQFPAWVIIIIISREFVISGFRLVATDNGAAIVASYQGKFKTALQMAAVILMVFNIPALALMTNIVVVTAAALTIMPPVGYVARNVRILIEGDT